MVSSEIERGLGADSDWFEHKRQGFIIVQAIKDDARLLLLNLQLDPGESEAILLADQLNKAMQFLTMKHWSSLVR
ncbi:MAG: hypothetical protein ACPG47_11870 [Leucothrix sp.]